MPFFVEILKMNGKKGRGCIAIYSCFTKHNFFSVLHTGAPIENAPKSALSKKKICQKPFLISVLPVFTKFVKAFMHYGS